MARTEFGQAFAAWAVTVQEDPDSGIQTVILPAEEFTLAIYDAPDGTGSLVSDFLDTSGNPISEITIPAGSPYIPRFAGPDGVDILWVQAATGDWLPIPHYLDSGDSNGGTGSDPNAVKLDGSNTTTISDPTVQFLRVDIQGAETDSPNRLEYRFWDEDTSEYRAGFHTNEKGLLRVRGVTANDVPVRLMAHPNLSAQWPVMEVTGDNSQADDQKHFQVFEHKIVAHRDVHATVLVGPTGEAFYWGSADPETSPLYADRRPQIGDGWWDYNETGTGEQA